MFSNFLQKLTKSSTSKKFPPFHKCYIKVLRLCLYLSIPLGAFPYSTEDTIPLFVPDQSSDFNLFHLDVQPLKCARYYSVLFGSFFIAGSFVFTVFAVDRENILLYNFSYTALLCNRAMITIQTTVLAFLLFYVIRNSKSFSLVIQQLPLLPQDKLNAYWQRHNFSALVVTIPVFLVVFIAALVNSCFNANNTVNLEHSSHLLMVDSLLIMVGTFLFLLNFIVILSMTCILCLMAICICALIAHLNSYIQKFVPELECQEKDQTNGKHSEMSQVVRCQTIRETSLSEPLPKELPMRSIVSSINTIMEFHDNCLSYFSTPVIVIFNKSLILCIGFVFFLTVPRPMWSQKLIAFALLFTIITPVTVICHIGDIVFEEVRKLSIRLTVISVFAKLNVKERRFGLN